MVVGNLTGILPETLIGEIETLVKVFQAVGGLIAAYIILYIVYLVLLRKRNVKLEEIRKIVERIDKKLNKKKK